MADEGREGLIDRRATARAEVQGTVVMRYDTSSDYVMHSVTNVSEGGMFIRTPDVRPVGTRMALRLLIAGSSSPVEGTGEVVWVRTVNEVREGPPGMAVRFVDMDPAAQLQIAVLVQERREKGRTAVNLGVPPMPLAVGGEDGDEPFGSGAPGEPVGDRPSSVAFDVFPVPSADGDVTGEASAPGVPDVILDGPAGFGPADGTSRRTFSTSGLIVAAVALIVLGIGVATYLRSRSSSGAGGAAGETPVVAAAAPGAHLSGEHRLQEAAGGAAASATNAPPAKQPAETAAAVAAVPSPSPGATAPAEPAAAVSPAPRRVKPRSGKTARPIRATPGPAPTSASPGRTSRTRQTTARRLNGIRIRRRAGGTRVELRFDGILSRSRLRSFPMENPPRFVLQLREIGAEDPYAVLRAGTPELASVRLGLHHTKRRRSFLQVVLDLHGTASPAVHLNGDVLVVEIPPAR